MKQITVYVNGEAKQYKKGTDLFTISQDFSHTVKHDILICRIKNDIKPLSTKLYADETLEFLDITDDNGFRAYQKTATMLLCYAVNKVFGEAVTCITEHSINKNHFFVLSDSTIPMTNELVASIKLEMQKAVEKNLHIEKISMETFEAPKFMNHHKQQTNLFKYRHSASMSIHKIENYFDYYLGILLPSTGYIKTFDLIKDEEGFMLLFPSKHNPNIVEESKRVVAIPKVFKEYASWMKLIGVENVSDLNIAVGEGKAGDIIRLSEALHEKKIAEIADRIHKNIDETKLVMIAGPSSSGKTTFAQRLCVQLRVNGIKPHVISIDNYFVSREHTPLDEFGEKDYESLYAIEVDLFNNDLKRVLAGEKVMLPTFNFVEGKKEYKGNFMQLKDKEIVVIEGIHGLNPELTRSIERKHKFQIFISALTQLNIDYHNRIPTSDSRLIRRIVRDNQYRGIDPIKTISMWNSVTRGEAKNIFPFQDEADTVFNSALVYELAILKQFIDPLLYNIEPSKREYSEGKRLVKFFECFLSMNVSDVPNNSIIREFIGGSCFRT